MIKYNNTLFEEIYNTYYDHVYKYIYMYVNNKENTESIISLTFNNTYSNLNTCNNLIDGKCLLFSKAHDSIIKFNKNKVVCFTSALSKKNIDNKNNNSTTNIATSLEKLPKELKQIMFLKYYGGLDSYEISRVLNTSQNMIHYKLLKATEKLKKIYSLSSEKSSNIIHRQSV